MQSSFLQMSAVEKTETKIEEEQYEEYEDDSATTAGAGAADAEGKQKEVKR